MPGKVGQVVDEARGPVSGFLDSALGMASGAMDSVSSGASTALDWGNTAGNAVNAAESSVWGGVTSAYDAASGAYNKVAPDFNKMNASVGSLVDMAEKGIHSGGQAMVDATSGVPVLGSLAQGAAWVGDTTAQVTGGAVKGAGDLTSMAGNAFFHPIDSAVGMAKGALGAAEHGGLMGIPGLGSAIKGAHGAYDILSGNTKGEYGANWGELVGHLAPGAQVDDDLKFWAGMGGGVEAWKDKPIEAASRTLMNLAPMAAGMAEGGLMLEGAPAPVGELPLPVGELPVPTSPLATTGHFPATFETAPTVPGAALEPLPPRGPIHAQVRGGPAVGPNGELTPGAVEPVVSPDTLPGLGDSAPFSEPPATRPDLGPPTQRSVPTQRGVGEPGPALPDEAAPLTERSPTPAFDDEALPPTQPSPGTVLIDDVLPSTQPRPPLNPVERALDPFRNVPDPDFRLSPSRRPRRGGR